MLTLPIKIGKKYVRRDGVVIKARKPHRNFGGCVFVGDGGANAISLLHVFKNTGRIYDDQHPRPEDLVADYIEQPATESDPHGKDPHTSGAKLDSGKVRPALVLGSFARALLQVSQVGTFGAAKYSDDGWVNVPDGIRRYDEAMMRHWLKEKAGEVADEDSNLLHAAHLAWNALARLDLMLRENHGERV